MQQLALFVFNCCSYHPELGGDQVGVLDGSVEGQDAVGAPAEQHGLKRRVGVKLESEREAEQEG